MSKFITASKKRRGAPDIEIIRNLEVDTGKAERTPSEFGGTLPKLQSFILFLGDQSNRTKASDKWFRIDGSEGMPDFLGYGCVDYKKGIILKSDREEWERLSKEQRAWVSPAPAPKGSRTVAVLVQHGYDSFIALSRAIDDSALSTMAFERK
ncbi:MAG: hypothetical protein KGH98_01375 [Candidatus Micrarchaeota archaeon]|nr:hypothetical protein [Candidatus Micrarchaeota archaeon]